MDFKLKLAALIEEGAEGEGLGTKLVLEAMLITLSALLHATVKAEDQDEALEEIYESLKRLMHQMTDIEKYMKDGGPSDKLLN